MYGRGGGLRFSRGRGRGSRQQEPPRYSRFDNNIFTVLADPDEDIVKDGGTHSIFFVEDISDHF